MVFTQWTDDLFSESPHKIVVDVSARAFYEPVRVTDFVNKNFNVRDDLRPLHDQVRLQVLVLPLLSYFMCCIAIFLYLNFERMVLRVNCSLLS